MPDEAPSLTAMIEPAFARGDRQAIQYDDVWYDWDWMRRASDRVEALLRDAGIETDQAVAIAPANRPSAAAPLLGMIARQREIVMIYAYQTPEAIARKLDDLNCAAIILQEDSWTDATREAARKAGALGISVSEEKQEVVPGTGVDQTIEHRRAGPERGLNLLTSGTTGPPKLRLLDYNMVRRSMVLETVTHPFGAPASPIPAMHVSAFGNIAGLYTWLPFVIADRPVIMRAKFDFEEWLAYMAKYDPVFGNLPPSGFRVLMDRDIPTEVLKNVKYMSAGASALDADLQDAVQKKYDVTILHAYGATEFGGVVSTVTPEHIEQFGREKSFSVGRPLAGCEFRIADPETGEILPPDTPGVLHVKVPRVGPEWIPTSDLAKLDADGFLYYVGRSDGAIVRGGFKIDPDAIRTALLEHPAIFDAIVTGAPDRRLGEVPVAAYVVRDAMEAPDADALKQHLRARLPSTFIPTGFKRLPELPYTHTSKPDLSAVRAMFAPADA